MNITKENIDALNAVIKVAIVADDYRAEVGMHGQRPPTRGTQHKHT